MSWLRSRRFFAGFLAGLLPLIFLAAQPTLDPSVEPSGDRVVVQNYSECRGSERANARTLALLETLPPDVVLVETFTGCCDCDSTRDHRGTAR